MKGNVLIVLPNDEMDGAEQVLFQIASYYVDHGYGVDVFFLKLKKYNGWDKMEGRMNLYYTTVNQERFGLPQMIRNLRRVASKKTYDFAYTSHTHITGIIGLMRRLGILEIKKFVARESTSIFIRFTGWKIRFFKLCYRSGFLQTDLLVCQTEFMRKQLFKGMPGFFKRMRMITVIPNPVVYQNFSLVVADERPYERKFLVSAGRLISEKGHDLLIRAFKEFADQYPELDLLILGKGNMKAELIQLIGDLDLKDRVKMVGHVKNVYPYFRFAEACVVSSRCEGFPNVLLQMMSQNKRVVSTLCAGGIELLKGVFTCEPYSAAELTTTIVHSLKDPCLENEALFTAELKGRDISIFVNKIHGMLNVEEIKEPEMVC